MWVWQSTWFKWGSGVRSGAVSAVLLKGLLGFDSSCVVLSLVCCSGPRLRFCPWILVLYDAAGIKASSKWFKVDFLPATISEWDGLFYFECKFNPSTAMQCMRCKMGLVWFWWAPCVPGCVTSAKQAAATPDSASDIHSSQQFFYTLTPFSATQYLLSEYRGQDRVISDRSWLLN